MEHATDRGSRKIVQKAVHEKSDFRKFHEKMKLVDVLTIKFNEISSLARISLPCGAALFNYMTRRALCLSSNTTPRVILRSVGRHGDDIFRSFIVDFLETCKIVCTTGIFCKSNTLRWCHVPMKWSMRPTGEAGKLSRRPCMKSRIFENFMKN